MKAYSIGRESSCDIVLSDSTDIVSRRHAVLNVYPSGKMFIIDQSRNGTYVNGIKISSNVPVPVTRKDMISFAHVVKLDWSLVPHSITWMRYSIMGFIGILLVVSSYFLYQYTDHRGSCNDKHSQEISIKDTTKTQQGKDTVKVDTAQNSVKQNKDSVKQKKPTTKPVVSAPISVKPDTNKTDTIKKNVSERPIG